MRTCSKCDFDENDNNFNFCGRCGNRLTPLSKTIKTTIYLHSSKDSNAEIGESLGLNDEAMKEFIYCCYEVGINIEVDRETGKYRILGVKE